MTAAPALDDISALHVLTDDDGSEHEREVERLVATTMPVARALARRYAGRGLPAEDLEQVAYLHLVAAARRFDPDRGVDFMAYAVPTIKGGLRKAFRDIGWTVRPPRRLQELQMRLWAAESELEHLLDRPPTPSELAAHVGADLGEAIEALSLDGCFTPGSLDMPLGDEGGQTQGDLLGDLDAGFAAGEARAMLGPVVRRLCDRDREIIRMRFYEGLSQREIGERLGVTQMQISRLLKRILGELRESLVGDTSAA